MSIQTKSIVSGQTVQSQPENTTKLQAAKKPAEAKDSLKSASTDAQATETPKKSCGERIKECFNAILAWIKDNLLCCFYGKNSDSTKKEENKASEAGKKEESSKTGVSNIETEIANFETASKHIGEYFSKSLKRADNIHKAISLGKEELEKSIKEFAIAIQSSQKGLIQQYCTFIRDQMVPALTYKNMACNTQAAHNLLLNFRTKCKMIISMKEAHALADMINAKTISPAAAIEIFKNLNVTQKNYIVEQLHIAQGQSDNNANAVLIYLRAIDNGYETPMIKTMKQIQNNRDAVIARDLRTKVDALKAQPAAAPRS